MINHPPFVKNPDGWHCIHAAMQSIIKHFKNEFYSFNYLNSLMTSNHDSWVWPLQVVSALDESGLFVRFFSGIDWSDDFFNSLPGKYVDKTDFNSLNYSRDYVNSHNLHEKCSLTSDELLGLIHDGCLLIVLIGSKKHLGKYVVITGFDDDNFYYHDSGPVDARPHKKIKQSDFFDLWSAEPLKNCAVVVYGKKYGDSYTRFHF